MSVPVGSIVCGAGGVLVGVTTEGWSAAEESAEACALKDVATEASGVVVALGASEPTTAASLVSLAVAEPVADAVAVGELLETPWMEASDVSWPTEVGSVAEAEAEGSAAASVALASVVGVVSDELATPNNGAVPDVTADGRPEVDAPAEDVVTEPEGSVAETAAAAAAAADDDDDVGSPVAEPSKVGALEAAGVEAEPELLLDDAGEAAGEAPSAVTDGVADVA